MTSAELKSPATSASPGNELPAASIVNLSKRFSTDVLAVDDVSLDVRNGVIFGLLGPNGAGKTTLLRTILGLSIRRQGSPLCSVSASHPAVLYLNESVR